MEVESDAVNSGLIYREGESSPKIERERERDRREDYGLSIFSP